MLFDISSFNTFQSIINPMIEIKDESGNLIGHRYDFNPWEESVIKITCCKKVQIDIAYWEVCSATGQILARLIECRTFLSPQNCNDNLSDIKYDCIVHSCIVYPFQQ